MCIDILLLAWYNPAPVDKELMSCLPSSGCHHLRQLHGWSTVQSCHAHRRCIWYNFIKENTSQNSQKTFQLRWFW